MKASELVADLNRLIDAHGDLSVSIADWNEASSSPPAPVGTVEIWRRIFVIYAR